MQVAVISDLHGNLPALEAVLNDIAAAQVDWLVVCGDIVAGPMPREMLDRLLSLEIPVQFIRGNGENDALATLRGDEPARVPEQYRDIVRWSAEQLALDHQHLMAEWPETLEVEIEGLGKVLFCHATPRDDNEIFTRATPEELLQPIFSGLDVDLVVCGHTHMQFDRTIGDIRVVNAGSLGMPFGRTEADWLLLGPDLEFRHTDYDLNAAAERILATDYPQAGEFVSRYLLDPPSEAEMIAVYRQAEPGIADRNRSS